MTTRLFLFTLVGTLCGPCAEARHMLQIVDAQTNRGVPLVEVCASSWACLWSDSNGVVSIDEPGWEGREVFLRIRSDGYRHAKNFFGQEGMQLTIRRNGRSVTKVERLNLAERLYRMTGEGIYRDSLLSGMSVPLRQPLWNAQVAGLDTVMHSVFQGKIFWLFGDTEKMSGSLGNLSATGAWSLLSGKGGLDPERGVDLEYVAAGDFVQPMAAIEGPGLKWLFAPMVVRASDGRERLFARYDRMKSLEVAYDSGIVEYSEARKRFEVARSFGSTPHLAPYGRATRVRTKAGDFFYFSAPYATPVVRVRAVAEDILNPEAYEALECAAQNCVWVKGGKPSEGFVVDIESGQRIAAKITSLNWNEYRGKWIAILQKNVGEVWYAEAESPVGPWGYAQRILEHPNYTFYWPGQVREFDSREGRRIWILGTYTQAFSPSQVKTPRYDYNQLVYGLNLDDQRLCLPEAVWKDDRRELRHFEILKAGCANLGKIYPNPDPKLRDDRN